MTGEAKGLSLSKLKSTKLKLRSGFTLVELIAILAILGVIAAVSVPSMIGFAAHGRQVNRANIARTIYLAAQNQMTELSITKRLKAEITNIYYDYDPATGEYTENEAALEADAVYEKLPIELGVSPSTENPDNELYVQYISKPRGDTSSPDALRLLKLLDPAITDKTILNDAILIEYNVRTGVVLSAFYGDLTDEFTYDDNGEISSIYGGRGMGAGGYEFAEARSQGYYGIGDTGSWTEEPEEEQPAIINVYDGVSRAMPGGEGCVNALYAEMLIPQIYLDSGDGLFELMINGEAVEENVPLRTAPNSLSAALTASNAVVYRYDGDINDGEGIEYARIIWVLDYVGGNMTDTGADSNTRHSIGEKYLLRNDGSARLSLTENLTAGVRGGGGAVEAESFTRAHPFFLTETRALYNNNMFSVNSARHLYNIRYAANGHFTQKEDIVLDGGEIHAVTNFAPIDNTAGTGFAGSYTGTGYLIKRLTVDLPANNGVGLFANVTGYIRGLTLDNPSVSGRSNVGAAAGTLNGRAEGIFVRYNDNGYDDETLRIISGTDNIGGIAGENRGSLTDSVFLSPFADVHISATGADKSTTGGITGSNAAGAELERILFLAVAPKSGDTPASETINPIAGAFGAELRDAGSLFYLSGTGYRPELSEYNSISTNGVGTGCGTDEMYEFSVTGAGSALTGWLSVFNAESPIDPVILESTLYPYPRSALSELIPAYPFWPVAQGVPLSIELYDSYDSDMPGGEGCKNALYAEIIIPRGQLGTGREYSLFINNIAVAENISLDGFTATSETLSAALSRYDESDNLFKHLIYRNDDTADAENARLIWALDYVGGDMSDNAASNARHSIYNKYFAGDSEMLSAVAPISENLTVRINSARSVREERNAYFYTESVKTTSNPYGGGNSFRIQSMRHLYNIRYHRGGIFTQRVDLNPQTESAPHAVTAMSPIPELTGSYTGRHMGSSYTIKNLTVIGTAGEDAGLFGRVSGSVTGLTLENPAVSGGGTTGAICGTLTNSGAINGVYVRYTTGNANTITGGGATGGIAGVNSGALRNSTFISPNAITHINGDTSKTGGITGINNVSARLSNTLFLAVSPGSGSSISPITGENNASPANLGGLYYLSGTPVRPLLASGEGYNTADNNGLGTRLGTNELFQVGISGWNAPLQSEEAEILKLDNVLYPYLHFYPVTSTYSQLASYPHWPIAEGGGEIKLSHIAYYEIYEDNAYGAWFSRDSAGNGSLNNDKTIKEAGYAVIVGGNLQGRYFFARTGASSAWVNISPSQMNFSNNTDFARGISEAAGIPGSWVYKLPLGSLSSLSASTAPLQIMHSESAAGNSPEEIYGFMHPLFAKGLYAYSDIVPDIRDFYIRTPWQMQNINTVIDQTAGRSFKQETNIDFRNTGMGVNASSAGVSYNNLTNSAVRGTFNGTYNGNKQAVSNVIFSNNGFSTSGLFARNNGVIRDVNLRSSLITGQTVLGGIAGQNESNGKIIFCTVTDTEVTGVNTLGGITGQNHGTITDSTVEKSDERASVTSNNDRIGGIAGVNTKIIDNCAVTDANVSGNSDVGGIAGQNTGSVTKSTVKNAEVTSRNDDAGGIAGESSGAVELCLVSDTEIRGGVNNAGGIVGNNTGSIGKSGVRYSTVNKSNASLTAGGIAGTNGTNGTVRDVYFISMADLYSDAPVSSNGGGIVGRNNGEVRHALYLAPAPSVTSGSSGREQTVIYPIVRNGTESALTNEDTETCFYLSGNRYSLDKGFSWYEESYNRVRMISDTSSVTKEGGGAGLITRFIDTEWLEFYYGVNLPNWIQPSSGYPYPHISGLETPDNWPETDSPIRPDQADRTDWAEMLSTSGRAIDLGFVNGYFTGAYINRVTDYQASWGDNSVGTNQGATVRIFVNGGVDGWKTRLVDPDDVGRTVSASDPAQNGPYNVDNWIELQEPINNPAYSGEWNSYHHFMYTDYKGDYQAVPDIFNEPSYRYAELNAEKAGTLYQVCPTTPGQRFIYSFYHTTNIPNNVSNGNTVTTDKMNFYLTGVGNESTGLMPGDRLTLIRPCWSPRNRGVNTTTIGKDSQNINWNPSVRNSIAYPVSGNDSIYVGSEDLSYYRDKFLDSNGNSRFPANNKPYLYDVWISSLGYGITFWSTNNVSIGSNAIPLAGVANISNLPASIRNDAQNNIIGYWGISYGWKQYYGMYEVPAGQNRTEFAYQSRKLTGQNAGNYLDGVSFKAPAFLSIDKFARMENAQGVLEDVRFIKPGDTVTMELVVKSWGEIPAHNIEIEDQFYPYTDYFSYVPDSVTVTKGGSSIIPQQIVQPSAGNKEKLTITLNPDETLSGSEAITIRFKLRALYNVKGTDGGVSTLLYYFRNQAVVSYRNSEFKAFAEALVKDKNGSGPNPVQVFIDPISLGNTVRTVGATGGDTLVNGPFEVTMTVKDTLEGSNAISTTGIISVVIPKGFNLVGGVTDINGNAASASYTPNADESTRITIRDVALNSENKDTGLLYKFTLEYNGSGYGVSYTSITADYKYLYSSGGENLNVMLEFKRPVVGIRVIARPDTFKVTDAEARVLDITANDNFREKLSDDNYDVTPVVMLTDAAGNPVTSFVNGNYHISNENFAATLIRGSNMLEFTPVSGKYGNFELYYKIGLLATKEGGSPASFELSSQPARVVVSVVPSITVSSSVKSRDYTGTGIDPLIDGPFEVTCTVENEQASPVTTTNGNVYIAVPKDFDVIDRSKLPQSAAVVKNQTDGTTLITIPDANLSDGTQSLSYTYTVEYTGNGYGVAFINVTDETRYEFEENGSLLTVELTESPVVGISIITADDVFEISNDGAQSRLDITANDTFAEKLEAGGYDVSPVFILTDEQGNAYPLNSSGNYHIQNINYDAEFDRADNKLVFSPRDGMYGSAEIYYKIALRAEKEGGTPPSFELSSKNISNSDITKVTINVSPVALTAAARVGAADTFDITLMAENKNTVQEIITTDGEFRFVLGSGLEITPESIVGTALENASFTNNADGTTYVVVPGMNFGQGAQSVSVTFTARLTDASVSPHTIIAGAEFVYNENGNSYVIKLASPLTPDAAGATAFEMGGEDETGETGETGDVSVTGNEAQDIAIVISGITLPMIYFFVRKRKPIGKK